MRSFIGGTSDPEAVKLSTDELVKQVNYAVHWGVLRKLSYLLQYQVHNDLKKTILKDYAPDPAVLGVKKWEKAIPQYERYTLHPQVECDNLKTLITAQRAR